MSTARDPEGSMPAARIWLSALAIAACGLVYAWPRPEPPAQVEDDAYFRFDRLTNPSPALVFVGTSLMSAAVPYDRPAQDFASSFTPSARTVRIIRHGHDGPAMIRILNRCVEARPSMIIAQIEPFLMDLESAGFRARWMSDLKKFAKRTREELRSGRDKAVVAQPINPNDGEIESSRAQQRFAAQPGLRGLKTIDLEELDGASELRELIRSARPKQVRLIFATMPRSASAAVVAGEEFEQSYSANLQKFETRFGVEVWRPAVSWPDEFFFDRSHVNVRGRKRFLEALRKKLAEENAPRPES